MRISGRNVGECGISAWKGCCLFSLTIAIRGASCGFIERSPCALSLACANSPICDTTTIVNTTLKQRLDIPARLSSWREIIAEIESSWYIIPSEPLCGWQVHCVQLACEL
jgi:hypothetical protein